MKNKHTYAFFFAFLEYIAFFPVFIWLNGLFLADEIAGVKWIYLLIGYFGGVIIGLVIKNQVVRWFSFVIVTGLIIFVLGFSLTWHLVIASPLIGLTIYRGFLYATDNPHSVLPLQTLWVFSVPAYFFSYTIFRINTSFNYNENLLSWIGVLFIVILVFVSNSVHLKQATLAKQNQKQIHLTVRRQNQFYLVGLLFFVALLTQFNLIRTALSFIFRLFFIIIRWFLSIFVGDPTRDESVGELEVEFELVEGGEPSLFAQIIDQVLLVIMIIMFSIALLAIIYLIIRSIPVIVRRLKQLINKIVDYFNKGGKKRSEDTKEAYQDEKESLFNWQEWQQKLFDQTKRMVTKQWKKKPNWNKLTDQEKVRFLYKQFIKQAEEVGYLKKDSDTAHEYLVRIGDDVELSEDSRMELDRLYNQARYSTKPLDGLQGLAQFGELRK